jgi:flavin reductase (DIM6/NTAB) family NADH-FMN oxidoreductase RutF
MSDLSPVSHLGAFDVAGFRKAMGAFVTGVTVVTVLDQDGIASGLTANSFTSVSLTPPLVLVCIRNSSHNARLIGEAGRFAVNVLADDQIAVSSRFASKVVANKFEGVNWSLSAGGSPILGNVVSWFDCAVSQIIEAGDHVIIVGAVDDFASTAAQPLAYCRGAYVAFSSHKEAVTAAGSIRVGALIERDDSILLVADGDGRLHLPTGHSIGPVGDPKSLQGKLRGLGLEVKLGFLFSVFEEAGFERTETAIYYRGDLRFKEADSPAQLHALTRIPWDRIASSDDRSMIARLITEKGEEHIGVFAGLKSEGVLRRILSSG